MWQKIRGNFLIIFGLVFLVCSSMIGTGLQIQTTNHSPFTLSETIIVDNEGDGDFTSIQEAINSASSGSLIIVYSGIYNEKIEINKYIELQGIDEEYGNGTDEGKPVIQGDGSGPVVELLADSIVVSGFIINNGYIGILVNKVKDIIISNNIISHIESDSNKATAIDVWTVEEMNIQIIHNEIRDNDKGIYIWNIVPNFGIIQQNNFMNNEFEHFDFHTTLKGLLGNDRQSIISGNYWDRHLITSLPKCIMGRLFLKHFDISWFVFDWNAALEPYDI